MHVLTIIVIIMKIICTFSPAIDRPGLRDVPPLPSRTVTFKPASICRGFALKTRKPKARPSSIAPCHSFGPFAARAVAGAI